MSCNRGRLVLLHGQKQRHPGLSWRPSGHGLVGPQFRRPGLRPAHSKTQLSSSSQAILRTFSTQSFTCLGLQTQRQAPLSFPPGLPSSLGAQAVGQPRYQALRSLAKSCEALRSLAHCLSLAGDNTQHGSSRASTETMHSMHSMHSMRSLASTLPSIPKLCGDSAYGLI